MQPDGTIAPLPIQTEEDFNKRYWFRPDQLVVVTNPLKTNYQFIVEQRSYMIQAGQDQQMTGFIANVYLDQMSRIVAQNDNKFEYMIDPALRAQYYDSLIRTVNDVIPEYVEQKPYLTNQVQQNQPQPFAHLANQAAGAPTSGVPEKPAPFAPEQSPVDTVVEQPQPQPVAQSTPPKDYSFELNGSKYDLRHVEEQPFYTKDGQPIEANEYYQAVSMV